MNDPKPRGYAFLASIVLVFSIFPLSAVPVPVTGRFEVYCDGVGIYLDKVDGAPSGKLVLFYRVRTFSSYIGQGKWQDAYVLPKGCVPDGKCEHIAIGKVWIDEWDEEETGEAPPKKSISGKYEIDLNGKHLEGQFVVKMFQRRHPLRICM